MQQPLYIYDLRYVQHKDFDAKICAPQCPVPWWLRDMHLATCKKKRTIFLFIVVIYLALFLKFAFCYFGIHCPHSSLHWLTQCVLSSLFTALIHSVFTALTLHCTASISVSCFQYSLPSLAQCLLPHFFIALFHLVYTVLTFHCTYSLSVYCPPASLYCFS